MSLLLNLFYYIFLATQANVTIQKLIFELKETVLKKLLIKFYLRLYNLKVVILIMFQLKPAIYFTTLGTYVNLCEI